MLNSSKYILSFLIIGLLIFSIKFFNRIIPNDSNYKEATIIKCFYPGKSHTTHIEGIFKIDNISYKSVGFITASVFSTDYLNKLLVHKKAIVVFKKDDPNRSVIIFSKKNFDYYKVPFNNENVFLDSLLGKYDNNYNWP
jgi:hypothetical protein